MSEPKVSHTDGIRMTRTEFLKEHRSLVKTLKHPTRKGLQKQAREQGAELKREKR